MLWILLSESVKCLHVTIELFLMLILSGVSEIEVKDVRIHSFEVLGSKTVNSNIETYAASNRTRQLRLEGRGFIVGNISLIDHNNVAICYLEMKL